MDYVIKWRVVHPTEEQRAMYQVPMIVVQELNDSIAQPIPIRHYATAITIKIEVDFSEFAPDELQHHHRWVEFIKWQAQREIENHERFVKQFLDDTCQRLASFKWPDVNLKED